MFKHYQSITQQASDNEKLIITEFSEKRENKALEIKESLETESSKIIKGQVLKDYNPIEINNKITQLNAEYTQIIIDEQQMLEQLKIDINKKLVALMPWDVILPVTEISKIINKCNGTNPHICRVWFTLIPIENTHARGDVVRVEWLLINGTARNSDTNCSIVNTAHLTNNDITCRIFPENGCVSNAPHFISDGSQRNDESNKFWREWVMENRPIKS